MRSFFIFLSDCTADEVSDFLDQSLSSSSSSPRQWILGPKEAPFLWLELIIKRPFLEEPDNIKSAEARLDKVPEVLLIGDVSGRHHVREQVLALCNLVLSRFQGVVEDDHSPKAWTLSELEQKLVKDKPFFPE